MNRIFYIQIILTIAFVTVVANNGIAEENQREQLEKSLASLNDLISDKPTRYHHDRAELHFRLGNFKESIEDYDTAVKFGWPHDDNSCWERGLAQYYGGDFKGGKEQFTRYHRVGALDIENGIWRLLCVAEDEGIKTAQETVIGYPHRVRPPFPELLALYLGKGKPEEVIQEAKNGVTSEQELTVNLFNAHYYLGKYFEILDEKQLALTHFEKALTHRIPHFMYACAEVDATRLREVAVHKP